MKSSQNTSSADVAPLNGAEPRAGSSTTPVVVIFILLGLLFFWGGIYLDRNAGGFDPRVYSKYSSIAEVRIANPTTGVDPLKGKIVYEKYCLPCHQANGGGVAGTFPPLGGSEWVLTPSPARAISIVLDGLTGPITVKGEQYNNAMVPWRDVLKDDDIAAVVTYIRSGFGNKASAATPEQVKKIRDATVDRGGAAWTADELLKVPESE